MGELMNIGGAGEPLTMTSREIAELVDARHDSVKRAIERLAEKGAISQPPSVDGPKSANGVVEKLYLVGERDSYVIVAQLSPEFTGRLVDRWRELEVLVKQQPDPRPVIPQTLPEALRLAADLAEGKAKAEAALAIAAPKADALDRIAANEEAVTMTQAAKLLGIKREALTNWMNANGWVYRQNGAWVPYHQHIENGRLQYKEAHYTDEDTGQERHKPYCHIFPKGLAKLAEVFSQRSAA